MGVNKQYGVGKIIEYFPEYLVVEFFTSIFSRTLKNVLPSEMQHIHELPQQTRCYVLNEDNSWQIGRIGRKYNADYEVLFPQNIARYVPEQQIYVRCLSPIDDPIDTLIYKGHETPFFHDRRIALNRSLIRQRAMGHGMSGLLSSRISLLPHQVEVVRRVLEDPIQRYLLADEVGLGKTIEAGVILRQFLLDHDEGQAVVIVPSLLVHQWSEELENKFQLSRFDEGRVNVLGHDDVNIINDLLGVDFVIIDEAHHIAAYAASESLETICQYTLYEKLCNAASSVILLSATPVLNNDRNFLAMLHLLDPTRYPIEDTDGFRAKVQNRQEVGQILLSLQESSPAFVIRSAVQRLRHAFPADSILAHLCDELQLALECTPVDQDSRNTTIRLLRIHMSETYRLHRRMLRNRRDVIQLDSIAGRSTNATPTPRIIEHDFDERSSRLHELLEEWRDTASGSLITLQEMPRELNETALITLFRILYIAVGTGTNILQSVVEVRLDQRPPTPPVVEIAGADLHILQRTPLFPGEREILEGMLETINSSTEDDRIDLLRQSLELVRRRAGGGPPPKCVVFTSHTTVCCEIIRQLQSEFGEMGVAGCHSHMTRDTVEDELSKFRLWSTCFVLVCDQAGEEGRNLQFVDRIIHFDLPLAPNRIEQRMGRLDRIGRHTLVKSTIFVGPESTHSLFEAWYKVLDQGFQVFDRSIAGLQFFVEEHVPSLIRTLFRQGADGLLEQIPEIQKGIAEEQQRLLEQDALDAIDVTASHAMQTFASIGTVEAEHEEFQAALHGWINEALRFERDHEVNEQDQRIHYCPRFDHYGKLKTLVPSDWLKQRFLPNLLTPGTCDRAVALRLPGTPLFRIGEGFIDEVTRYLNWDDRGQAFALWRHEPSWNADEGAEWIGFRFNYVITTDLQHAESILNSHRFPSSAIRALSRRADALFPPHVEVVYLDTDGMPPVDPILSILDRPYRSADKGGTDYNLANERLEVIDDVVPKELWENVCRRIRKESVEAVMTRGDPPLCTQWSNFADQAERQLATRLDQLRCRSMHSSTREGAAQTEDLDIEASINESLVRGMRVPKFRLDSVGFMVVSGRPPRLTQVVHER